MKAKETLKELHNAIQILPRIRGKVVYERLRTKIGADIRSIMGEQGVEIEVLAHRLRMSADKTRDWIWSRDLTLKELSKLLNALDAELWPLIRTRKLRR